MMRGALLDHDALLGAFWAGDVDDFEGEKLVILPRLLPPLAPLLPLGGKVGEREKVGSVGKNGKEGKLMEGMVGSNSIDRMGQLELEGRGHVVAIACGQLHSFLLCLDGSVTSPLSPPPPLFVVNSTPSFSALLARSLPPHPPHPLP